MLLRYTRSDTGKTVKQAEIYTLEEHGISTEKVDPDAYMITRRLRAQGHEAYIVGGAVRDWLIGREPKDFDIATNATPRQLKKIFSRSRIIGKRFRLVHVYFRGNKIIEVATFRSGKDGETNIFGTLDEDVKRRDFTHNALYYCPKDQYIIDHVGGVKDIRKKRLKNVIPLDEIFVEDPVRMVRGIKYAVLSGAKVPRDLGSKIKSNAALLKEVSPSRLTEEFFKILLSGLSKPVFENYRKYQVLEAFMPNLAHGLKKGTKVTSNRFWKALGVIDEFLITGGELSRGDVVKALIEPFLEEKGYKDQRDPVEITEVKHVIKSVFYPVVFSNKEIEYAVEGLFQDWGTLPPKKKRRTRRRRPRQTRPKAQKVQ